MKRPRFSFIIVAYNNADTIELCLGSIAAWTGDSHEILVIDNSPDPETTQAVRRSMANRSDQAIHLIEARQNIGFSRACNLGARLAQGDFLFFLNPDTQLLNNTAGLLAGCLEKQTLAVVAGPAILDSLGRLTYTCRNLPTIGRVILDVTGLDRWFGTYRLTRFRHDAPKKVEQIIGAAMLVRRDDYEGLGGMDEQFFIYFEEVDFCKRFKEAGGEIWFRPEARVQHLGGASCEAGPVRARMIFTLRTSRKKYFVKHFGVFWGGVLELVNRWEGIQKSLVLAGLWALRRKPSYREKAWGFWSVAVGISPKH